MYCLSFCRAMLCISAAFAVMQCLSVRPSVCPSRSWILSKRINLSLNLFFHNRVATPFQFFRTKRLGNIPTVPPPLTGASNADARGRQNRDSRRIYGCRIDDLQSANNCDGPPCSLPHRPPRISESCLSQPAWTSMTNRTEQNLIARSIKSEAKVIKDCARRIVGYY